MGAVSIDVVARGNSMAEAFKSAQEEHEGELGRDIYNGGINNCRLVSDWTHKYNGKNLNSLSESAINYCSKREVIGICLDKPKLNENKTKSKVERVVQKGTRKWETVYRGVASNLFLNGRLDRRVVCEANTQAECIKKARAYVEKNDHVNVTIEISKKLVSGSGICANVLYKKSNTEKKGRYLFIGMAPC